MRCKNISLSSQEHHYFITNIIILAGALYRLRYPVKIWLIAVDYREDDDLGKLIAVQLSDPLLPIF